MRHHRNERTWTVREMLYPVAVMAFLLGALTLWIVATRQQHRTTDQLRLVRRQVCTNVRTVRQFLRIAEKIRPLEAQVTRAHIQVHLAMVSGRDGSTTATRQWAALAARLALLERAAGAYDTELARNLVLPACTDVRVVIPPAPRILR